MSAGQALTPLPPVLDRLQRGAFTAGGLGLVTSFGFLAARPDQFFRSYLLAFVFCIGFPLGCLALLMVHHLTGGWWGLPIRKPLEAGMRTFPVLLILFIPLVFGLNRIYPWTNGAVTANPSLPFKHFYLSRDFFFVRAAIYFAIWLFLSYIMNKWSAEQDRTADQRFAKYLEGISGPGLILFGITVTFASIDWVMSLEPGWFSTIYGMIFMVIYALGALALVINISQATTNFAPVSHVVTRDQFNDLGNLMLTFVMLWAYLNFSQFLIIWAGNLKNEITFYMTRANGAWAGLALFLVLFHFAIPFLLLLQRSVKRRLKVLSIVCGALIVISFVDMYWLVVPAFQPLGPRLHPLDLTLLVGIFGIWFGTYVWQLRRSPLLPLHDPRFEGTATEFGD